MLLYKLFLWLYTAGIRVAALFNPKAALWLRGRNGILQQLAASLPAGEQRIWMHCASLGEFEQGRPVLEALRRQYPAYRLVLTFFSPSGYEIRKDYEGADYVFYLPMDSRRNAQAFLRAVQPELVLFVKYEFWYYYLDELRRRRIPALLVSAVFRKEQAFFKWYGGFFRKMLRAFSCVFVQDALSKELLAGIGIEGRYLMHNSTPSVLEIDGEKLPVNGGIVSVPRVRVAGDTRYDRVLEIAARAKDLPKIAAFKGNDRLLVGGSTWPADEAVLRSMLDVLPPGWKLVLAPHEIDAAHIQQVQQLFGPDAILYTDYVQRPEAGRRALIINNIGLLSSLYRYGDIAFIGGGFNKGGIHNVLEPAVFGLPVLFGPVYKKFVEAVALAERGLAFPVQDATAAHAVLQELIHASAYMDLREQLKAFTRSQSGATEHIMQVIAWQLGPA